MNRSGKYKLFALGISTLMALNMYGSKEPEPVTEMGKRHYALAKQTELESIVMLENKDNILPLNKSTQDKIAVFGNGALVPTNGSSGSGTVSGAFTYNLYEGLEAIGVSYNERVYNHYKDNITITYGFGVSMKVNHHWNTSDPSKWGNPRFSNSGWNRSSPISTPELDLEDSMVSSAAGSSSDKTAVVYITRGVGTEEMDRFDQPSDWYLNPSEYTLLKQVTRAFDQVVVILNTSGSIDLSWMDFAWLVNDPDYNDGGTITQADAKACADRIKGLIVTYGSGSYHGLVVAQLLYGEADFSGKLGDSMTKTYDRQPTKDNFHYKTYADKGLNYRNFNSLNGRNDPIYLYQEGIFTGYRYFDTFAAEDVLYPFGYGLTYNTYKFDNYSTEAYDMKEVISVSAKISNVSGNKTLPPGKEVMEIYVSAPEGKLEQPYQKLLDYAKTQYLDQGEGETITVDIPVSDLASYDEKKAAYILETGDYIIRVGNSSRNTHIAGIITVNKEITVEQLSNKLTLNGADPKNLADNEAVYNSMRFSTKAKRPANPAIYGYKNPNDRKELKKARASAVVIDMDYVEFKDNSGNNTSFSTGHAPGNHVATLTAVKKGEISIPDFVAQLTKDELVNFLSGGYGARNSDQYYNDDLALQINNLISKDAGKGWIGGAGSSRNIRRLGIPSLTYADGSAGISIGATNAEKLGIDQNPGFARAAGMACTWNPKLQNQWGRAIGEEMRAINVDIWLAPSINLHRNPLNGRNTEYYSEDPVLSGKIAAHVATGVAENGVTVCLKHFAGNDQEWYRRGLHTPASDAQDISKDAANTIESERALREITLKPFEIAVKSGHVMCVMSAFNKINGKYCAASHELLTDVLRGEWHFQGFVVTDWGDFDEIPHAADEMSAGNDMIMSGFHNRFSIPDQIYQNVVTSYVGASHTVSFNQLQRNAAHVLRTILSSKNAFDGNDNYNLEKHSSSKLEILSSQLPVAIVGKDYASIKVNPVVIAGSEGTSTYTFSLAGTDNALPGSLVLHGNGTITGIPASEDIGKYDLVFQVKDDQGNVATKSLELEVANLSITTADLPVGRLEMNYATQFNGFTILGGRVPYLFDLQHGPLPDGLQLKSDGKISGVPRETGEFPISVRVTDSQNNSIVRDYNLKVEEVINVTLSPSSPMTDATAGNNVNIGISASRTGFNDAYVYRLIVAPDWLNLSSNWFGTSITGIPAGPGTYSFKLKVDIADSQVTMEVPYTLIVKGSQAASGFEITTSKLYDGTVNVPYSQTISTSGGTGIKSFAFTGAGDHPDGLSISPDGTITWTPAGQDYGYHTLEIRAKDGENNEAVKTFQLYILGGIQIDPPDATEWQASINKEFSKRISAGGGTVESYTYVLSDKGDKLPKGLTFSNGLISGTPAPGTAGKYSLIIRASENGGSFSGAEVKYHLNVSE
jgi:beta-glucosidase-like glycosyl hydrolase